MPEPHAAWIQLWPLGPDRYAMTWGGTPTSLVFDVFVTGVTLDANHAPTLDSTYVNVSATSGVTQNSDHAIVRPTGDGRAWLAWRETDYGPRVALLSQDLQPTLILSPSVNFPCSSDSSIGARVDAEGTLHLVAGTRANEGTGRQVRYWKIPLP